jgi:hypothetical protein
MQALAPHLATTAADAITAAAIAVGCDAGMNLCAD